MYKLVIIEDEQKLAEALIRMLSEVAPQCRVMGVAPSIKEAIQLISEVKPDIAFLDVELKDGLCFELLEKLPEINFETIFITAHSSYAINAFKYSAVDFVVKPADPDDVAVAVEKAIKSIADKNINERIKLLLQNRGEDQENQRIILYTADTVHYVLIKNIKYCEADVNYTSFYLNEGEKVVTSKTIGEFERLLPSCFFRVHRTYLINLNFVSQLKKRSNTVILSQGEKIPVSVRKKEALLNRLKDFF